MGRDYFKWNPIYADADAGSSLMRAGAQMQAKALDPISRVLQNYNAIQAQNAESMRDANTGKLMMDIYQGKEVNPEGFYSSKDLANAVRTHAVDVLNEKIKNARLAIAQAQNSRAATRFGWDKEDRASGGGYQPIPLPNLFGNPVPQPAQPAQQGNPVPQPSAKPQQGNPAAKPAQPSGGNAGGSSGGITMNQPSSQATPQVPAGGAGGGGSVLENAIARNQAAMGYTPYNTPMGGTTPASSNTDGSSPLDRALANVKAKQVNPNNPEEVAQMMLAVSNEQSPAPQAGPRVAVANTGVGVPPSAQGVVNKTVQQAPVTQQNIGVKSINKAKNLAWDNSWYATDPQVQPIIQNMPKSVVNAKKQYFNGTERVRQAENKLDTWYQQAIQAASNIPSTKRRNSEMKRVETMAKLMKKQIDTEKRKNEKFKPRAEMFDKLFEKQYGRRPSANVPEGAVTDSNGNPVLKMFKTTDEQGRETTRYFPVDAYGRPIVAKDDNGNPTGYDMGIGTKEPTLSQQDKVFLRDLGTSQAYYDKGLNITNNKEYEDIFGPIAAWFDRSDPEYSTSGVGQLFATGDSKRAAKFDAAVAAMKQSIIKSMGANPSDRDLKIIENMIPTRYDEPDVAREKMKAFYEFSNKKTAQGLNRLLRTNPSAVKSMLFDKDGKVKRGVVPGYRLYEHDDGTLEYVPWKGGK